MSVRLFVLGALREGEAHGYDIIEKGRSWGLESWTDVSFSSIYHALRSLARDGLAREASRGSESGRPERTVYRITAKGKAAFESLMLEASGEVRPAKDPIYLVLGFMRMMDPGERARMLALRAATLDSLAEGAEAKIAYLEANLPSDRWAIEAVRLYSARIEAERAWLRGLSGL